MAVFVSAFWSSQCFIFLCLSLIVLALCNWPNPFRNPHTESHWPCRHYWHHHWPALDPSELYCRYNLPNNGSSVRPELAVFSRCDGSICWLLHDSWFGARRGLWDQYLRCYGRRGKQADHTHKANTCWWLISFTSLIGRGGFWYARGGNKNLRASFQSNFFWKGTLKFPEGICF